MNKNGLVEKLEAAVINKDKKAFINIIFDFTVDDIIALNDNEFDRILYISNELKIENVDEFFEYLQDEGSFNLDNAMNGVNEFNSILICRFYYELYIHLWMKHDIKFASALSNGGIAYSLLSEMGTNAVFNLKTAMHLFQDAQKIFPQTSTSYASTAMNEGNTRLRLAERGVDTEENLNTAVKLYQVAQKIFPQTSSSYASAVMSEGIARQILAERGVDTEEKLNTTKNLYTKSILIFENLRDFGGYSIALLNLNRFFINNYRRSGDRKYLDEAKNILEDTEVKIKDREIWDKKLIIAQLHEIRASILEFEGKPGINKASREYSKAHELTGNTCLL